MWTHLFFCFIGEYILGENKIPQENSKTKNKNYEEMKGKGEKSWRGKEKGKNQERSKEKEKNHHSTSEMGYSICQIDWAWNPSSPLSAIYSHNSSACCLLKALKNCVCVFCFVFYSQWCCSPSSISQHLHFQKLYYYLFLPFLLVSLVPHAPIYC